MQGLIGLMLWEWRKRVDGFLLGVNPTPGEARELKLKEPECSVGIDESNDLVVHDNSVSRRHALIRRHRNKWQVRDRDSTNGTSVGDRKVIDWITLHDGHEMRFGAARFVFRIGQTSYGRNIDRSRTRQGHVFGLRLTVVLILAELIAGFAATQYLIYRSYQQKEASLHDSRPKR
jgi:pSer/pThr/pTyr-binding forkhead associated (FHA) protein